MFNRDTTVVCVNTFNPWIASDLDSNMDLQLVLDPYSCAAYVVDHVNKYNLGIGNLHREHLKIHEANPEFDQAQLVSKVALEVLNGVERSAHEAAWYLLRQPMSCATRITVMMPTTIPQGRYEVRELKATMIAEDLPIDSTDIWTKNIIQKHGERPTTLGSVNLAQFAAWYGPTKRSADK